jgi:hypothetical protein
MVWPVGIGPKPDVFSGWSTADAVEIIKRAVKNNKPTAAARNDAHKPLWGVAVDRLALHFSGRFDVMNLPSLGSTRPCCY